MSDGWPESLRRKTVKNTVIHFRSTVQQHFVTEFCLFCCIQPFSKVSSEVRNSPFPILTHPPPAAHPPPHSSTSICSTSMCTAATPSASGPAASRTVLSKQKRKLFFQPYQIKRFSFFQQAVMGAAPCSIQDSQAQACNCTHPFNHLQAHTHTRIDSPGAYGVCARCPRSGSGWLLHVCSASTFATCFATLCSEVQYRNLHAPGLSRWFSSCVAFSPVSVLWQCRQLYSTVVLPSCCISFLSNSAFTQLLLTFLPPLLICPPTTKTVGGGACSCWLGWAKLD